MTTHPTYITLNPIGRILPSSLYAIQGHLNGIAATLLVDTGSVISLVQTDLWNFIDPNCQNMKPYTGPSLVGVAGAPLPGRWTGQHYS